MIVVLRAQEIVWCPVGKHIELGYRTRGTSGTYVCRECGFIFPFDKDGKIGTPVKIQDVKNASAVVRRYCGPDGCVCHE